MKIVSLLPSATEIVYALGLEDQLLAVTHECDYPPGAKSKPVITRSVLSADLSSWEIDQAVRAQLGQSESLYTIDRQMLAELQPDLVLTQQLCTVCAVSYGDIQAAVCSLPQPGPHILSLEPTTLEDVLQTISLIGEAAGRAGQAAAVVGHLRTRIEFIRAAAKKAANRPRTLLLEWIDPLFGGGHWDPELIEIAGGLDAIGRMHQPSTQVSWESIQDFAPEVIVVAQCGFSIERSAQDMPILQMLPGYDTLPAVQTGRVYLANGSDYFSRPGPRLVDSLEILAPLLHPELFGEQPGCAEQVVQWT